MIYSSLTSGVLLSPNFSKRLGYKVTKITPHQAAGKINAYNLANIFTKESREASANYCIGDDGLIFCSVPEEYRAWTSSSAWNDRQAITIEIANDVNGYPWSVGEKAWKAFKDLFLDLCLRYDIYPDLPDGDINKNITYHRYYAETTCPGPWIEQHLPALIKETRKAMDELKKIEEQITILVKAVKDYDKRIDALETVVAGYVYPRYHTIDDIKNDPRASWAVPYVNWALENKIIYGISAEDLGLSYNDLRLLAYIKRASELK